MPALYANLGGNTLGRILPEPRGSTCGTCGRTGTREAVAVLEAAFEHNPLPGIILRACRPFALNAAARILFDREAPMDFAGFLRSVATSGKKSPPSLHFSGRRFEVVTCVRARPESADSTRICFLLERSGATAHAGSMADRCGLTAAQYRIVVLLTDGLTNREIGRRLGISAETVRKQMGRILAKTGCRTRTAVVAAAIAGGGGSP